MDGTHQVAFAEYGDLTSCLRRQWWRACKVVEIGSLHVKVDGEEEDCVLRVVFSE